jgi:hypothetical protein
MHVKLLELTRTSLLAGATNGLTALTRLISLIKRCSEAQLFVLDFAGIELATASFLRECVLGFRDYCRQSQANLYPIIANANQIVEEELGLLLQDRNEAMIACKVSGSKLSKSHLIGFLDEKLKLTLSAAVERGSVEAGTLAEHYLDAEKIGVTGWNNRLANLSAAGLLIETKAGRAKTYRPIVEGIHLGE